MLPKIKRLREIIDSRGLAIKIEVDGGVNKKTIGPVAAAGADVYVAGTAIFGTKDYGQAIKELRRQIDQALKGHK
jgi:ribulose-phosphate 3-epimerase